MRARLSLLFGTLLAVGLAACGDEQKSAAPSDVFGAGGSGGSGSNGGSSGVFCEGYCEAIVAKGDGCEHYNDDNRCVQICEFYRQTACADLYVAFAQCMKDAAHVGCFEDAGGKLGLMVYDCNAEFDTWHTCADEKDAGICPY